MDLKDLNEVSPVKMGVLSLAIVAGATTGYKGADKIIEAPGKIYRWFRDGQAAREAQKELDAKAKKKA